MAKDKEMIVSPLTLCLYYQMRRRMNYFLEGGHKL